MAAGQSLSYRTRVIASQGPPATYGSRTMTLHPEELGEESSVGDSGTTRPEDAVVVDGTLKLHGGSSVDRKVQWDEGVVDNEGMGKKKSKVCCIYHKPRAFDESSSSSESSSSEDDDNHSHNRENEDIGNSHRHHHHGHNKRPSRNRSDSPNAYERQPQYKDRPKPPRPSPEENQTSQ
ncbi:hypothetical protein G9A89_023488 [Geosiphon pyriformis]|nr:hypothetical protein G9A89_023488 [Geosiphon pyriformis]